MTDGRSREIVRTDRGEPATEPGISLLRLVNILLRGRWLILGGALVVALAAVAWGLLQPRTYSTSASFVAQQDEGPLSRLQGLASQLGVALPVPSAERSPRFYADLLLTRGILRRAAATRYEVAVEARRGADTLRGDLAALFDVPGSSPAAREAAAIRALRDRLEVSTAGETGVVRFSVGTRWPGLSEAVGRRLVELVEEFDVETRRSQAQAERSFLQRRLEGAGEELLQAEERLETFLEGNRRYENSPALRFEHDRLARRVELRQQVYSTLAQALEQARIEEVRNTPVITVVDPVERPVEPDGRHLALRGVLGLLLGGFLGAAVAVGAEFLRLARREDPEEYLRFRELRGRLRADVRAVGRQVGGWWRIRKDEG